MLLELISILNLFMLTFALGCGFYVYFQFIKIKKVKKYYYGYISSKNG